MSTLRAITFLAQALSVDNEVVALGELLKGTGFLRVGLALALGGGVALLLVLLGRWLRRVGLDPHNRATLAATLLTFAAFVLVLNDMLQWFLERVPLLTIGAIFAMLLLVGFSGVNIVQDLMAGVGLILRRRVYAGVHLSIDDHEGSVQRIGPTTVSILTSGGATLHIPNKRFRQTRFLTRSPHSTAQVNISFQCERAATAAQVLDARRAAMLCPYRSHASDVSVRVAGDRDQVILITFHAPTESLARSAEQFMRRTLEGRFEV